MELKSPYSKYYHRKALSRRYNKTIYLVYYEPEKGLPHIAIQKVYPNTPELKAIADHEANIMKTASENNPYVVEYYDTEVTSTEIRIYMEFLPQKTLSYKLFKYRASNRIFQLPKLLQAIEHLSTGLCKLHSIGLMHRDIKSENIYCSPERMKLGDFGESSLSDAPIYSIHGTQQHLPPELFFYSGGEIDYKAVDVWCLGKVFLEMILSEPMISLEFEMQVERKYPLAIAEKILEAPAEFRNTRLPRLIFRMLAYRPAERPEMQQVREEASSFVAG